MVLGAKMSRREGESTISEAAYKLELHPDTIRNWCKARMAGEASRLQKVRMCAARRYWIHQDDIDRILKEVEEDNAWVDKSPATWR